MAIKAYARVKHLEVGDIIVPSPLADDTLDADYREILYNAQENGEVVKVTEIQEDDNEYTLTFDTEKYSIMLDLDPYTLVEITL